MFSSIVTAQLSRPLPNCQPIQLWITSDYRLLHPITINYRGIDHEKNISQHDKCEDFLNIQPRLCRSEIITSGHSEIKRVLQRISRGELDDLETLLIVSWAISPMF